MEMGRNALSPPGCACLHMPVAPGLCMVHACYLILNHEHSCYPVNIPTTSSSTKAKSTLQNLILKSLKTLNERILT